MKESNNLEFIRNQLPKDIERLKERVNIGTGFKYLDEHLPLLPGLYTLGGASGLGKTTLAYQIADQLAEQGEEVIFFSLEMGQFEMVSKSISRYTVILSDKEGSSKATSTDIRSGKVSRGQEETVARAIEEYTRIADAITVVEGTAEINIYSIGEYVETFIKERGSRPVVIVDYIQAVPGIGTEDTAQERIDNVVLELRRMSRDFETPIIAISSLNRANYNYPIAFESFKGSGGIEFTSDVVLGLQLQVLSDDDFIRENNIVGKREMINESMMEHPRKVELVILKNRNGIPGFITKFDYYSKYDLFIEQKPTIDFPIRDIRSRL